MKTVLAAIIATLAITGCATKAEHGETPPEVYAFDADGERAELYDAAKKCVLDHVTPPESADFFSMENRKYGSFRFEYFSEMNIDKLDVVPLYVKVRATIRFSAKKKTVKGTYVRWKSESDGWIYNTPEAVAKTNRVAKQIADCIPTYL